MQQRSMRQWWVVPGPTGGRSELRTVDVPSPGPTEVVVEVRASAINRGELIGRPHLVSSNPKARPAPSGIEFAGVIAEVGSEVTGHRPGQSVMGRGTACHADFTAIDHRALMTIPAGLSFDEAAAIPNVFVTAHDAMVTTAGLAAGQSVLVTAGSSGVGTAAIQIGRYLGAGSIIATTRSPDKAAALGRLGATEVVDTREGGWADRLSRDGGVDVVIDQVGGDLFRPALDAMAIGGRYVTVGRNGGREATIDLDLVARKRLSLFGVTFRTRSAEEALACSHRFARDLLPGFDDGSLKPVVDRRFALDALPDAHEYMAGDQQLGKIVLVS
ncbi:MAG: zinc-binding dehydrogenase [Acidimicrobiales bacterium]